MNITPITMQTLDVMGGYGRNYDTVSEVMADWTDGKDFKIFAGPYTSARDTVAMINDGYTKICVWYGKVPNFLGLRHTIDLQPLKIPAAPSRGRATVAPTLAPVKKKGKR